jgi:ankyrin repeat protein
MPEELTEQELKFLQDVLDYARYGAADRLTAALDLGVPVNLTSGTGDSLLILAAYHRQADVVRLLLDRGADTGRVNDRGQTALGAAVFRQSGDIVTDLLRHGAEPAQGAPSALEIAAFFDLPEMAALLHPATG